jgi:hypothetical protein
MFARNQEGTLRPINTAKLLVLTLLLVATLACQGGCGKIDKAKESELQSVLKLSDESHRIEEFKKKSYSRQIDLYLYAMKSYPPRSLAPYLAANGDSILPTLLNRISTDADARNQQELIEALEVISILQPSLKENKQVLAVVRQKIEEMKDPFYRERAEKSLSIIVGAK